MLWSSVQVTPESVDVQMFAIYTTAASLLPSFDEVMSCQSLFGIDVGTNEVVAVAVFVNVTMVYMNASVRCTDCMAAL